MRRYLVINPPTAGFLTVAFGESSLVNPWFVLSTTTPPIILTLNDLGETLYQSVNAHVSVGQSVPFVEVNER